MSLDFYIYIYMYAYITYSHYFTVFYSHISCISILLTVAVFSHNTHVSDITPVPDGHVPSLQ